MKIQSRIEYGLSEESGNGSGTRYGKPENNIHSEEEAAQIKTILGVLILYRSVQDELAKKNITWIEAKRIAKD